MSGSRGVATLGWSGALISFSIYCLGFGFVVFQGGVDFDAIMTLVTAHGACTAPQGNAYLHVAIDNKTFPVYTVLRQNVCASQQMCLSVLKCMCCPNRRQQTSADVASRRGEALGNSPSDVVL